MRTFLVIAALLAGSLPAPAQASEAASTHHVDCTAAAGGDGSESAPYNTLAAVNALVLQPGERVLFKRGTRCAGTFAPQGSGTPGSPIVADAYGSGAKPAIDGGGASDAILLRNVQQWELRNLEVTNTGPAVANRRGVHLVLDDFGTGTYYRLTNLTVHHVNGDLKKDLGGSSGIHLDVTGGTVKTKYDDVVLDGNEVYTVDRSGINMSSAWWCRASVNCSGEQAYHPWSRVVVRNNTVHDIGGDGVVMQYTEGGLAEYNTLYDINLRSGQLNNAGLWVWNADRVTFQFNEVYRVKRPAGTNDGNAFDADYGTDGTLYQYNYSHDNEGGMILFCGCGGGTSSTKNAVVRYNISQNDKSRIVMAAGATDSSFHNNTVYLAPGSTTKIVEEYSAATYLRVANNLIVNHGSGGYEMTARNYTFTNNLMYGTHPANEPADPFKVTADPQLSAPGTGPSGYTLKPGSPALARGTAIPGGGRDYYGNPVPPGCAPDIGAHQRSTTCVPQAILANGGFETGTLAPWYAWNSAGVVTGQARSGAYAVRVGPGPASVEQRIAVEPGVPYTLKGWAKGARVGVKNHGGAELSQPGGANAYAQVSMTFTPTGAAATIYCYKPSGANGYCDDLSVSR